MSPSRRAAFVGAAAVAVGAVLPRLPTPVASAMAATKGTRVPRPEAIEQALATAYKLARDVTSGKNADYIPYLAHVPSHLFGIAAMTPDGMLHQIGDTGYAFAIESISKAFTLALAIEQSGTAVVRKKIGADPTGEPFNSVIALELHGDRPLNAFVNAGAIATVSLIQAKDAAERWDRIIGIYDRFAGRKLTVNADVYKSETATNQHNRAIAWLLKSAGTIYSDPTTALDIYTRQCSVAVTAGDLAVMGATLCDGGVNPRTQQRVVSAEVTTRVLAEMTMNGLYDDTGNWIYRTGLPAKSGVGGGIMAVAPGRLAITAFSPPLDTFGNSVRAQIAIREIARQLGISIFRA